ncbi:MAG: hypothetical protein ACLSG5_08675 [Oscillospiraceae bacterium]
MPAISTAIDGKSLLSMQQGQAMGVSAKWNAARVRFCATEKAFQ